MLLRLPATVLTPAPGSVMLQARERTRKAATRAAPSYGAVPLVSDVEAVASAVQRDTARIQEGGVRAYAVRVRRHVSSSAGNRRDGSVGCLRRARWCGEKEKGDSIAQSRHRSISVERSCPVCLALLLSCLAPTAYVGADTISSRSAASLRQLASASWRRALGVQRESSLRSRFGSG